ncbi:UDP-glucose 4-epimerase GalE [Aurantiacibacter xanthus]|uniref:UDP-glucose 4-epimerase n=1 Tax=Aurantiacibacter xanthus TaxID=1784712 RepID=A0A3A1P570_9SPHN|nr:UDP-glucose 4-epimerase GalE [Aurantiacibacter xanthus]RIV82337.1 UDP-glucose 4-epimerase GalE [Aurantiacibacter xanthus]
MKRVFVTGGAGYVGAHCCKAFAADGWEVVTFDDLSRGWREAVRWGPLIEGSLLDREALGRAMDETRPDLVAHFAAFAYVGESVGDPGLYYRNNTVASLNLMQELVARAAVPVLFSGTCASYGNPQFLPITEDHPQVPINPYGWSKLFVEKMLHSFHAAHGLNSVTLRYFNAAGADPDGEIGERHEPETHAIPLAIEAAINEAADFTVFGTDFDTPDGTPVRDYIHVTDLADAHVRAANYLLREAGCHAFNLGTGQGTSVKELLAAVARAVGAEPKVTWGARRAGDPAILVASAQKAKSHLGWTPAHSSIEEIVESALTWRNSMGR